MQLLILPGWGQHSDHWQMFYNQIQDQIKTTVIDLPGFGKQQLVSPQWGIPEYAMWLDELIKSNFKGDIAILAHSFGGRVAAYLAAQQPQYLQKLILYGAPLLDRPRLKARWIRSLARRSPIKYSINPELKQADELGLGQIYRKVVNFDQTQTLPQITCPTWQVVGEHDQEVRVEVAQEAAKLIPNSQLKIVPNTGHNIHIEQPNLFYGVITQIITTW